jgi:hypothetical protein
VLAVVADKSPMIHPSFIAHRNAMPASCPEPSHQPLNSTLDRRLNDV